MKCTSAGTQSQNHKANRPQTQPHLQARCQPPAAFAEALGCFACLDIPGHDYAQLLRATSLHTFLAELASGDSSAVQPEVVEAVGLLCSDAASAEMLVFAGLVRGVCLCGPAGGLQGRHALARSQIVKQQCAWVQVTATHRKELLAFLPPLAAPFRPPHLALCSCPQVESLHTLMLHRVDDDDFVLATTVAAARLLAQVRLGGRGADVFIKRVGGTRAAGGGARADGWQADRVRALP